MPKLPDLKNGSTTFLKTVVLFGGVTVFVLCLLLVNTLLTENVGGYKPILLGMLVASVPFYFGLYQTLNLLNFIDHKKAFTKSSITALNKIKYCGFLISALYGIGMPYIIIVAERDDAPGVILLGLIFTFAPLAVAVIASVLQKVLTDAMHLKTENDLII